ncbi:hypothetical protein B0H10DRAFT_1992855 [Mycena sp. CBHHK59/15]|nr:hypothetical protein B0H10DRAFT_1992855 [Mycena sp. CBHHK59/15]
MVQPSPRHEHVTLPLLLRWRTEAILNRPAKTSLSRCLVSQLQGMQLNGPKVRYMNDLSRCVDAFEKGDRPNPSDPDATIQGHLRPETLLQRSLHQTGQWPSTGPESLVRQLSQEYRHRLSEPWKAVLSRYAARLSDVQQQRRLDLLSRSGFEAGRAREAEKRGGSQGWSPTEYPDWLLIQLDADLLIRPLQASIAKQMMFPENNSNALMQLNMGEGKSSVIVPIVSAALADGEQLVRVIVLKPLSAQMFQLLKQRVCGLSNRRLFYLPFSRDINLDADKIRQIDSLLKECARVGGILLCQPEHILSFQLMGLHTFCHDDECSESTRKLIETQEWLDSAARDILDESDEILSVRYQLIYTLGTAGTLEGQPWRWDIIQEVFSLLAANLDDLAVAHPDGVELKRIPSEPRQFPATRILNRECCQALLNAITRQVVVEDRMRSVSFRTYSADQKQLVVRFLSQADIRSEESEELKAFSGDLFNQILLLRGLIGHGILKLSLQEKRWRVDYGLDPERSMLAVPYRAKDSPAPRAEFGHPDVIIALTCLSYYYGGLTNDQLDVTFKHLLNSDNPAIRYEDWVKDYKDLPESLTNLRGLNLDDIEQRNDHVFPHLRFNKAVIDFYLSECVFPKQAREFKHKLTTNAWDLARSRKRLTTGFSGTNDNKYLLPLSIQQLDPESQRHTNAQVLEYILQAENREVLCTNSDNALGLLSRVVEQSPPVMVLLDVGAQVLELQNEEVARKWLELETRPSVEATVYFNSSDDEIRVVSRDGRIEPLASSLYRTQLEKTLVYLDEAHTRGTDFKFPGGTRAVVTLGPKLTKDKLVQGCMRMRRLGSGHSVLFFASAEIWSKITASCNVPPTRGLDSSHVLLWTIQETCTQIRDNGPLWVQQGINFDVRRTAYDDNRAGVLSDSNLAAVLKEREAHTLEELYGVQEPFEPGVEELSERQLMIRNRCAELGIVSSRDSMLLEEQERELAHEKEDEREVERIAHAQPLSHRIDRAIYAFIRGGSDSHSFMSMWDCLTDTSRISLLPQGDVFRGRKLRATKDFRDTVVLSSSSAGSMDSYLRPVQWILSSDKSDVLLLIKTAHLHLYTPRVSRTTRSFEGLEGFAVPRPRTIPLARQIIHELNLFAGQLFFADRESMTQVCILLGLYLKPIPDRLQGTVDHTGFVETRARAELGVGACSFVSNPLRFFNELFGYRRKGQGFALTHMGQVLRGHDLEDDDFERAGV